MIDIETEVFSIVSAEVRKKYPKIYMTGEYVKSPPSFPCVSLIETDNQVYRNTRDSGCIENHAQVLYEVNVYSNKTSGKKTECKAIIALIDSKMEALGFTRTLRPSCRTRKERLADGQGLDWQYSGSIASSKSCEIRLELCERVGR